VPNVGSCAAGAGAFPVAVAAQCLSTQRLPARINAGRVVGLDAAAAPARDAALRTVLAVSIGLGGQVAAVLLRRAS
jgi:3-oxoacyl-(acyl-carrier-protein) synthase